MQRKTNTHTQNQQENKNWLWGWGGGGLSRAMDNQPKLHEPTHKITYLPPFPHQSTWKVCFFFSYFLFIINISRIVEQHIYMGIKKFEDKEFSPSFSSLYSK